MAIRQNQFSSGPAEGSPDLIRDAPQGLCILDFKDTVLHYQKI
jgi:hypothetical protein